MVELITRKPTATEKLHVREATPLLFFLALLLFFAAVASYGGFYLLNRNLRQSRTELLKQISLKEEELSPKALEQIFLLESRLKSLGEILSAHVLSTKVLGALETETLLPVRFTRLSFEPGTQRLNLTGEATSFAVLSKQISRIQQSPLVSQVEFGGLSLSAERRVIFSLNITLVPSAFRQR
jgi:hypothetical protein